jgi:plasmid stabilization system protein ParE
MRFTVLWKPDAENKLIRLWMESADRQSVRNAADEIDRLLANDPLAEGESRSVDIRVLFVEPLAVFYAVREQDRIVEVARVWRIS